MFIKKMYLKEELYKKLKATLITLYLLNLSDLFFTKYILGSEPEMFREANVFLAPIIGGVVPYILKIAVIGAVLYYWYFRSRNSDDKDLKRSLIASTIMTVLYVMINIMHLFNLALLIYLK